MTTTRRLARVTAASSGIGQAAGLALVDAGPGADWVCTLGRIGPALVFDKQIRTRNRLAS
jgi:NAD(P)-dependent dehydrogenase (short-subunit alcohol dehydrogenase family)